MVFRTGDLLPGRLYLRAALEQQGAHPRHLASGALQRPLPGVYCRADAPASLHEIARVLQQRIVPGSTISHQTAAELLGLPLPRRLTREGGARLHCRVARPGSARSGRLLVVHRGAPALRYRWRGVELSHPLVVLQELSGLLDHDDLVCALDSVAGGKTVIPPMPVLELRHRAAPLQGSGAARVRAALEDARDRVWSPMETRARLLLVRHGFPEPTANLEIRDPLTGDVFFIDLAYHLSRVAIEYDSEDHRLDRARWRRDLHKNEVLHQLGWSVLRISIEDLRRPRAFLTRLEALGAVSSSNRILTSTIRSGPGERNVDPAPSGVW